MTDPRTGRRCWPAAVVLAVAAGKLWPERPEFRLGEPSHGLSSSATWPVAGASQGRAQGWVSDAGGDGRLTAPTRCSFGIRIAHQAMTAPNAPTRIIPLTSPAISGA